MFSVIFPGQGSQLVGMGKEFFEKYSLVQDLFEKADSVLGIKLSNIILNGPKEELDLTANTQPAIFLVSYSIYQVITKEFSIDLAKAKYFAGHSLGEYSALVSANSLNFEDALFLLSERGKAMQAAVPLGKGSMLAVLGSNLNEISNLIKNIIKDNIVCEIANDNADGQLILSGDSEAIKFFQITLKQKKIKSIPLKVSAPFHCSLMKPAAETMREKINKTNFIQPSLGIINNVTAEVETDQSNIKKLLIQQIYSTVQWRQSLINMSKMGIKNFIEIGPGKVLTGMVKRTVKDANTFSINSITDIKNLTNELRK